MNDKDAQKVPAPLGPVERGARPACWEFAMDFLGDPEAPVVDAYVGSLEAEVARLRAAALEVIELNRQHAHDQYGDADKCETWACVRTLRSALGHNIKIAAKDAT